jgi:hypothetical protein
MKKLLAVALVLIVLSPGLAFAGSSADAALGLGAFAVFNQILSGTGIFGGILGRQAVVVAPPPPVIYEPAPVVYAPPPPVVVRPAPVFVPSSGYYANGGYYPNGGYYTPAPVYRHAPRPLPVARGWCSPGYMKHGRCY